MSELESSEHGRTVNDLENERKGETMSLRIDERTNWCLEAEAERRGVAKSAVVREACRELFSNNTNR